MSVNEYRFEVPLDNEVEMVESISSPEAVVTTEDNDITERPTTIEPTSKPITQNSNCTSNYNNRLDEEDCTIIDSDDHSNLNVKHTSKKRKRKFPKSLKAKLLGYRWETRKLTNALSLQDSISYDNVESNIRHRNEETIVIEEDSEKDNDCDIIECVNTEAAQNKTNNTHPSCTKVENFEELLRNDKDLADLIEICLDMENTAGMLRIINRTVIPIYRDTNNDFKLSAPFQKQMTITMSKLQNEPNRKFTHLKDFCEFMKSGVHKKRAKLTTIKTNLNGKFSSSTTKSHNSSTNHTPKKKKKIDIITLDDDEDAPVHNKDDTESQVTSYDLDKTEMDDSGAEINATNMTDTNLIKSVLSGNDTCDLKNDTPITDQDAELNTQNEMQILIQDVRSEAAEISHSPDNNNHIQDTNVNSEKELKANEINVYNGHDTNEAQDEMDVICLEDDSDNINKENMSQCASIKDPQARIQILENKIRDIKKIIQKFEEREVDWDKDNDENSPYVRCEHYKSLVIKLYKSLCKLTGNEAVKRRRVRLKVVEGRHEAPVRFLEDFVNNNIDENGNPPFPDIQDVINCVTAANLYHSIGWSKKDIEMEARALFLHLGRTFQKKRQKREWRHLMRYVKEEVTDPADSDAALLARLEDNARLALKKENELFDRYAELDNQRTTIEPCYPTIAAVAGASHQQHNNNEVAISVPPPSPPNNRRLQINSYEESCNGNITDNIEMYKAPTSDRVTVKLPSVVAIPFNVAVEQSVIPVTYYTNTVGDPVLDNILATTNTEDTTSNRANNNPKVERPMVEIEIDMQQNLNTMNGVHRNVSKSSIIPIEYEHDKGVNRKIQINRVIDRGISCLINLNNAPANSANSKQKVNDHSNKSNIGTSVTGSRVNQASISTTTFSTDFSAGASFSQVYTHTTNKRDKVSDKAHTVASPENVIVRELLDVPSMLAALGDNYTVSILDIEDPHRTNETDKASEKANTNEETPENEVVKQEPLDIPKMLLDLGDNYTVSIMDIEDPFEVIEVSDSSDSDEDL